MNDPISRQAALDELDARCESECEYSKKQRSIMCDACYLGSAKEVIEALPTIDAVPVVRCKDCKWWGLSEYNTFGIHVCKKFSGVRGESDYCSRAERSEE